MGRKYAGTLGVGARMFDYAGNLWAGQSGLVNEEQFLTVSGNRAWYVETDADGYVVVYVMVTVP